MNIEEKEGKKKRGKEQTIKNCDLLVLTNTSNVWKIPKLKMETGWYLSIEIWYIFSAKILKFESLLY